MDNQQQEPLTSEKSLEIIYQMINDARANVTNSGAGWLFYGALIFLASLSTYIFIEVGYQYIFLGWNIFGAIILILLLIKAFRPSPKKVRNYMDELLRIFDIGFMVCIFLIILSINLHVRPNDGFGFFLMIYGLLMLVQGGAMRFRPLIAGAIFNWIGAIAIFFNEDFRYDMLITSVAVLIGYIVPGLILRNQYNKRLNRI